MLVEFIPLSVLVGHVVFSQDVLVEEPLVAEPGSVQLSLQSDRRDVYP